jgi:hypothetical protein
MDIGMVTVAPLSTSAPAISMILLGLLAVVLGVAAAVILRRRSARLASGLIVTIAAVSLATAGYAAFVTVVISDDECSRPTTEDYPPNAGAQPTLNSQCPNPIRIIDIKVMCEFEEVTSPQELPPVCEVGMILNDGNSCRLPVCDS